MKIRTNLLAGQTFQECDSQRDWWKQQAQLMEQYASNVNAGPPPGLWLPSQPVPPSGGTGGGYVNGVYYPDQSGVCGGTTTPKPPVSGGGYVNGVYYPDKSGTC